MGLEGLIVSFRSIELISYIVEGVAYWMGLEIRTEGNNELFIETVVK